MITDILVEGPLDAAVARRLIADYGHAHGDTFGNQGVAYLRYGVHGFSRRATYGRPMLALIDCIESHREHNEIFSLLIDFSAQICYS